jgi:predicted methyltransferase
MRTPILVAAAFAIALGCNVKYSSSSTASNNPEPTADPNAGKPIETAEPAGKPIDKPDPEAEKKAKEKAEYDAAIKKLEEDAAKEAARWTPEMRAEVVKLTSTKWPNAKKGLTVALAGSYRMPGNKERDKDRHPVKTMEVFGLRPDMRVFEVGPGAGWWTELLAVVLAQKGKLVIAGFDAKSDNLGVAFNGRAQELKFGNAPELYGKLELLPASPGSYNFGEPDSLDMVLNMRMTHNLVRAGNLEKFLAAAFAALKPGGVLAIEQHRAAEGADPKTSSEKGYVPEKWLIEQVEAAGFKLEKKSEVNANPKDTKDYPQGVWTLPPNFAEGDKDKAKYEAIGESDRMTLKFVKPKAPKRTPDIKGKVAPKTEPEAPAKPAEEPGKAVAPVKGKAIAPKGATTEGETTK